MALLPDFRKVRVMACRCHLIALPEDDTHSNKRCCCCREQAGQDHGVPHQGTMNLFHTPSQ